MSNTKIKMMSKDEYKNFLRSLDPKTFRTFCVLENKYGFSKAKEIVVNAFLYLEVYKDIK